MMVCPDYLKGFKAWNDYAIAYLDRSVYLDQYIEIGYNYPVIKSGKIEGYP